MVLGETANYMNLPVMCHEHSAPCHMCSSSRILWNEKPVHGAIAQRIAENNQAIPCGPETLEIQYEVIMKRDVILKRMYPTEQGLIRLNAAKKQIASMIKK